MAKGNRDSDNFGNLVDDKSEQIKQMDEMDDAELDGQSAEPLPDLFSVKISKSLHRKLIDYAREEGVVVDELAAELLSEGVVLRAWEIIERKQTMRGGHSQFNRQSQGSNVNGNVAQGGQHQGGQQHRGQFQQGGNRQAQKKLQRQARQHANAMDLLQDKAAFIEYVRNQEKKRR